MKTWKTSLLPLLFVAVFFTQPAGGTTVLPVSLTEQVDRAELIFVGTVVGIESVPVKDGSFAFTYVTFDVQETLKGTASGGVLTLRFAGGDAAPWVYEVAHGPRFQAGGKHLLFVEGNDRNLVPLVGFHQGKFDIEPDPVTQEPVLVDHGRRAVDGVREANWSHRAGQRDARGQGRARQPHAVVVSEEGVDVELLEPEEESEGDAPRPASQVLEDLRSLIRNRSFLADFRRADPVQSASPANVPATLQYRPARAAAPAEK
jgi:hypothetical protein